MGAGPLMAKRRRYSDQQLGSTIEQLMAETGTTYRGLADLATQRDLGSLRKCVSAGEALSAATRKLWKDSTGIEIIDGIGATEMFHIFISHDEAHARPGATGTVVPGYRACVMDDAVDVRRRAETTDLRIARGDVLKWVQDR